MTSAEESFWVGVTGPLLALFLTFCSAAGLWLSRKLPQGAVRRFLLTRVWKDKREPPT